jgi:Uma2 family endonuclease
MIATPDRLPMTFQEYLAWEPQQPGKYEYIEGVAYAMTGGTIPHNDIALNLYTLLRPHLRAKGCRVNVADVKVKASPTGPYFYPDLVVSCDVQDQRARDLIQSPCLIVEVLSPGTAGFDRGDKFKFYRRIKTLQEYVLIDSEAISIEVYRRTDRGKWELTPYPPDEDSLNEAGSSVHFTSIDFSCPLTLIYEAVELGEFPNTAT